jgi:nucleoside phosphorylase
MTAGDPISGEWLICVATAHERHPLTRPLGLIRAGDVETAPLFEGRVGGHPVIVVQTGIGPKRAHRVVAHLLEHRMRGEGCLGVISIGVSGGLQSSLPTGAFVIGDCWVRVEGRFEGVRTIGPPADRGLCSAALRAADACGIAARKGVLVTVEHLAGAVDEKRALAVRTTGLAVDMESGAIAEAAMAAGIPVMAARVILDPLDEALDVPPERFLRSDGSSAVWKSALAVATRPAQLPVLWEIGHRSTRAMALLGRWLCRMLEKV